MLHYIRRFLRGFLTALLIVVVLLMAAVAYLGYTSSGNQFLANRIAEQVSTPDIRVSLEGASGLLEGRFHLERVTLADTKGKFAEIQGLDISWTPSELIKMRFHADRIAAAKVVFDRLPMKTVESEPSNSSFSLPVEIKVDSFDLPVFALGKAIAKQDTVLGINGSAQAVSDRIALDLSAAEKDRLNASARASVTYAVNTATLTLDGAVSEPQGGLLARLLALPGQPPVEIAVKGDGPLKDWKGSISGRVDGKDVLLLTGSHKLADGGIHEITLNGGGQIAELLPKQFRSLFAGETKVDVDARFAETGLVDIRAGTISNDSFTLAANGELDPKGQAKLTADLAPTKDAIHLELPLASGPVEADITKVNIVLGGAFRSATVDVSAALAGLQMPQLQAGALTLTAHSADLNLADRTATLSYALGAETIALQNPDAAKVVQGPLSLKGNLDISPASITLAETSLQSARLGGTVSGRFDRTVQTAATNFNLHLLPRGLLPPDIEAKIKGTLGLSGQVTATLPSQIAVQNLKLTSNLVAAVGSMSLAGDTVKASIAGDVRNLADFADQAAGAARFTLTASGALAKPDIKAWLTSPEVKFADKTIQAVDLTLESALDLERPGGKLTASAQYQGQTVIATADALFENGLVSVPAFKVTVGQNSISGALGFNAALLPSGKLTFDLPDIANLAKLAGQTVDGALKGTVDIATANGKIAGTISAAGPRLTSAGVEITNPKADLAIGDLIARQITGRIQADSIAFGANHLDQVALDLMLAGPQVDFDLASRFDAAPLTAKGQIRQQDDALTVKLASFAAKPHQVPVTLAKPTDIRVQAGMVHLAGLTMTAGQGSLTVDGTAGKTLDLTAEIVDLPASLADAFAKGLDAAGTISANAAITGEAAAPSIEFDADIRDIATSQTRNARLPDLTIAAKGAFRNNRLSIDATSVIRRQPASVTAEVKLDGGAVSIPSFSADIGDSSFSGKLALDQKFQPSGRIAFDIGDANALASIVEQKAEGAVKGTIDIVSKDGKLDAKVDATGTIRNQAIKARVEATVQNGAIALPSLTVDVGQNRVAGAITLDGTFLPSGRISFDFPDAALLAAMAGQQADGAVKGTVDIASANGRIDANVSANGMLNGQAIDLQTEAVSDKGAISLPSVLAKIGPNNFSAALTLDKTLMPSGKVTFDLPDLNLLAAMAGREAEGAIKGSADLTSLNGRIDAKVAATGTIRNQTIDIRTNIVSDHGAISLPSLMAQIGANDVSGAITLNKDFLPSGTISFDLPDVALLAAMAGQKAEGAVKGSADIAATDGKVDAKVTAKGLIRNQTIDIQTDVVWDHGAISIPSLKANIGANTLTGTLALDKAFLPSGQFSFDFPDIALLAAFAGQEAQGTLKGSATLETDNGRISGTITANGETVTAAGTRIVNPSVDLKIADLAAGQLSGHVTADQIASGLSRLDRLALNVDLVGRQTRFDLASQFDGAPLTAAGRLVQDNGGLKLSLDSFAAAPRKIPMKLAKAADIVISDGKITLSGLVIQAGEGSITIDGVAGKTLDLTIKIGSLPLSLANAVSPGLDAAGTVSGNIRVTGDAASPVVIFDSHIEDIATRQTKGAKLPGLTVDAKGQFAGNVLSLTADTTLRDQPTTIDASVRLGNGAISIPSFRADIGKSSFSGTLAFGQKFEPSGKIDFDIPDADALASIIEQKAEGALKGTADITSSEGKIGIKLDTTGTIRNQAIKAFAAIDIDGGAISLPSLKLDVGSNTLAGAVTLGKDFLPSGRISFDLPDVALLAAMAGQKAEGAIKGSADIMSDQGKIDAKVKATGLIRNQTIGIEANVVSDQGAVSIPSLKASVGSNALTGALAFGEAFLPSGRFSFDFPDIALLAGFAGQDAKGALKGNATLQSEDGKISGTITASGETVTAAGTRIVNPSIDLKIADLAAGQLSGHVTAEQIVSGANHLELLALNIDLVDRQTRFDLMSRFDGAPMTAEGRLLQQNGGLKLSLESFAAAPRKIPVKLAKPTDITIKDGTVTLAGLVIQAGNGSIAVDGAVGKTLDLTAKIDALPLSLANAFSPDLDAAGTVSADIKVAGDAASPVVTFDSRLADIATSQTRNAKLPAMTVTAKGQFAQNTLSLTADTTLRDQPAKVEASVKLDNGTVTIPSFKADIGNSSFSGALAFDPKFQPSGKISFDIPDANALASIVGQKAEGALKGTADITSNNGRIGIKLDATGTIRNQAVTALAEIGLDHGAISLPSLKLDVGSNSVAGAVTLGRDFLPSGKITFDLADVALLAAMAGRKAEGAIKGSADIASADGKVDARVTATGLIRNQAIDIQANLVSDHGAISVPSLKANIGANTLTGSLALDKAFLPSGQLSFDFPDIALLAAFAGQDAKGALKGSATLQSDSGKISGRVTASGETVTAAGAKIVNPSIDLRITDLAAGQLSGHVTADEIASGANHLDQLAINVDLVDRETRFNLTGRFDGAPLTAKGQLVQDDGGLKLSLSSFAAAPRGIPIKLSNATDFAIKDGAISLTNLAIQAGKGSITVSGTAGKTLDLTARIDALPLSLADAVSPGLDAVGTVSADIQVTGDAKSPVVAFDSRLADIATSQTKSVTLPNLTVTAKGQFADNTLSLTADSTLRDQKTKVQASVKLENGAVSIPSFKADIGKSSFSGALSLDPKFQPSGRVRFDIPDANALASIVQKKAEGALKGTADIASANGKIGVKLDATGTIRNQAIKALADIGLDKGAVSLPSLKLDVGSNTLSGAVTLGKDFLPSGKISFDLPDVALLAAMAGQKAEGAIKGTADIKSGQGKIDARVAATGLIRKQPIDVNVEAIRQGQQISLPALKIAVGKNTLSGALTLDKAYMPSGKVTFDLPDIALLAAMAGQKAAGAIKGSADVKAENGKISGAISAEGTKLTAAGVEVVKPLVDLKIDDLSTGQISGKVTADRVASGANVVTKLALDFTRSGARTAFDLKSQYDAAPLTAKGAIEQQPDGIAVSLDSFAAAPRKIPVKLNKPTRIAIKNGAVSLSNLAVSTGKGSIVVTGAAGKKLDLKAKITALPASLANTFSPGLDAAGTISANVTVRGDAAAPAVAFDTTWQGAAISQTRSAGLTTFTVTAKGQLANNVLSIHANAKGGGLSLNAAGTVGMTGNRSLNIKVDGQLPFSALGARLAAQGLDLRGNARFDITVTGAATNPSISGRITTSGATLTAIRQNLTVKNLAATVELTGKQARITSLTGALSGGGTLSVSGTVGIAPESGFPADIRIALKNAVYTDAKVVAAKLGGDLTITGSLLRGPKLGGTIRIRRADITIPQKLPGTLAQLDIKHKHPPRDVAIQAAEIKENQPGTKTGKDTGGLTLDLTIIAPRQIFVRGRGLDAELGGKVELTGSSRAPNASGGFKMLRGRLSIIGRRLDFTEGEISFGGNLTPALDLVATSTVEATTINVIVAGLASNPTVTFTSSPSLPQDEVMALLIFGRNSADLSPVQIAQLADAVSTLAGGQRNSLFNKLRQGLGVDDLDVGTDENGKSNVSVGKYLNKRTYLQLQQNVDDNTSSAIINLDIGKGVKLKGEAGSDGSTAGGVFFEKEY